MPIIEGGIHIAGILLIWGIPAIAFNYGISFNGSSFAFRLVPSIPLLGILFAVTGVLNAILYISYKVIDYWHETVHS